MSVDLEAPRPATGAGFSDAVTFSFGDEQTGVFGMARIGLADGAGSGLALLFAGRETVAARAEGGVATESWAWEAVRGRRRLDDDRGAAGALDGGLRRATRAASS